MNDNQFKYNIVMDKEEYKKKYEELRTDWNLIDIPGKVQQLNKLIEEGYKTEEMYELDTQIKNWDLRCYELLCWYEKLKKDNDDLESPERYIVGKQ